LKELCKPLTIWSVAGIQDLQGCQWIRLHPPRQEISQLNEARK
jgi:hypothetical protein